MTEIERTEQDQVQEELSAYLDGELDTESVRRVEERLARDSAFQAELQRLQRAWDLLDGLPRAAVSDAFTNKTLEMVAVAANDETEALTTPARAQLSWRRLASTLAVVIAAGLGFFVGQWVWPDPNRQLLEDLPVLQNFELYYQADDIEFLRRLEDEGLFGEGEIDRAN